MSKVMHNLNSVLHRGPGNRSYDPRSFLLSNPLGTKGPRCGTKFNQHVNRQKALRIGGILSSVGLLAVAALYAYPVVLQETPAEAAPGSFTPSTTSLVVTSASSTASADISVNSSTGTFATSDAASTATFTVSTNNLTGYNLSIASPSGDNTRQLVNGDDSTATIDSIGKNSGESSSITESTFRTNTLYTNRWAYKPSFFNSASNSNYLKAPDSNGDTINVTKCPNGSTNGSNSCPNATDTYSIALGAKVDYTKPAGTYSKTFILTAVGNPVPYQINYLDNTGSTVSGLPSAEGSSDATAAAFKLATTTPTRTGYAFNGWCAGTVTHNAAGNSTCSGTKYASGATYSFSSLSPTDTNVANLYAMWNVNSYNVKVNFAGSGVKNVVFTASGQTTRTVSTSGGTASLVYGVNYTMTMNFTSTEYDFSSWALNSSSYGTLSSTSINPSHFTSNASSSSAIITATGKVAVTYMQDFTASMCQSQASSSAITVRDRRDNQDYTVRYINGNCWMTRNLAIGCNGSGSSYGSSVSSKQLTSTYSNVSTAWSTPTALLSAASSSTQTADYTTPRMQCSSTYGAWYNYAAATAGTITGSSNTDTQTYDICPKGWRLPTQANADTLSSYKNIFYIGSSYGGEYYNGQNLRTDGAFYWTSTSYDATIRIRLIVSSDAINTRVDGRTRNTGFYIRCIRSS